MCCNCDCFGLLRLQLLHIAAGLESSSGDSERPFLRSSFCEGLYYSFVEHFSASSTESQNVVGPILALPRSHRSAFQSAKNKENRDLGSQNPQNFLACGAASRSPGLEDRNQLFCPNATLYGEPTPTLDRIGIPFPSLLYCGTIGCAETPEIVPRESATDVDKV